MSFEKADLRRADFTRADLRYANLRNADLREAVFDGTDLGGADFSGADLTGLSLRKSTLRPTTKGFAEALDRVAKPDLSYPVPDRPVVRRSGLERGLGPSRLSSLEQPAIPLQVRPTFRREFVDSGVRTQPLLTCDLRSRSNV